MNIPETDGRCPHCGGNIAPLNNMNLFSKKKKEKIPKGFTAEDIRVESSTCTGERTIGFFSKETGRLMFAELVKSDKDIENFYERYGIDYK